jgi:small subunit ribosomal protein S20
LELETGFMPHTRSAKKNLRKSEKRRIHNRTTIKTLKTHIKRFEAALDGPAETAQQEYNLAAKKLDKAAARRIIHPNLAARKKSQLARKLHQKKTQSTQPAPTP